MIEANFRKRFYTSTILLFFVFLIYNYKLFLTYFLIVLGVLSILEFLQISKKIFKNRFSLIPVNLLFIIFIFIFCIIFFLFSNIIGLKILLFIILFGCIGSDLGGFIFGKIFKGPKLTRISPNKTYSGALGSVIFSITIVSSLLFYLLKSFNLKIIIAGLMTSLFCQLGDLLFSLLKRKAKLKDTGNFLPGHGGILDRLDGIFIGIPFGLLTLILLI
tara:strand:- start:1083 stop:1733 length:651 start_codon:yes stop_codon:yes gene_type:complete